MTTVVIERFGYLPEGTLGELTCSNGYQCFTLERPWLQNQRNISCIPEGLYVCQPFSGKRFKNVIEICDVPSRSYILFHPANVVKELQGCIAPGGAFFIDDNTPRVVHSRNALDQLIWAAGKDFELKITSKSADK
jgi:hypothetical protein